MKFETVLKPFMAAAMCVCTAFGGADAATGSGGGTPVTITVKDWTGKVVTTVNGVTFDGNFKLDTADHFNGKVDYVTAFDGGTVVKNGTNAERASSSVVSYTGIAGKAFETEVFVQPYVPTADGYAIPDPFGVKAPDENRWVFTGTTGSSIKLASLTSFPTDVPGHHVTALGTSYRYGSLFSSENKAGYHVLTAVVAPEVTSIGDWFFYMPGTQFELAAFSPDLTYVGGWAFWNANGVKRFFPGRMEKLTKFGNNRPFNNLGGAVAEGLEPVDFVMPALKSVTPEAFATSKMVASVTATGVTSVSAQAFDACPSLTNVVFGKVLTSLGDYALRKLPGGATVHLPGRHAPTLGAGAIYSENASNRARILIRRNYPGSGWDDLLMPLTEEDLAREDYPGEMTLGTVQAAGTAYSAWLVETKPRTGLLLMVR